MSRPAVAGLPFRNIAAAFIVESALFSALSPLLPGLEHQFGLSTFGAGLLASSYTATTMLGSLTAGLWACRRFGVRPTALAGCILLGSATVGFGVAGSVSTLIVTRAAQGFGAGLIWCSLLSWIIMAVPEDSRGAAIGTIIGLSLFGSAAGPLLGTAAQIFGMFPVFVTISATVFVLAALLAGDQAPKEVEIAGSVGSGLRLVKSPKLRPLAFIGLAGPIMGGAVVTLVPLQLSAAGAGHAWINGVLLAGALIAAGSCLIAGRVADRLGGIRPTLAGAVGCVVSLLAMAASQSMIPLSTGYLVFMGPAMAFFTVPPMNLFASRGRELGMTPGASAMLLNLAMTLGLTIGPTIFTGLDQVTNNAVPYLMLAVLGLPCLAIMMRLLRIQTADHRARSAATVSGYPNP